MGKGRCEPFTLWLAVDDLAFGLFGLLPLGLYAQAVGPGATA
jgi:hypothetical protein